MNRTSRRPWVVPLAALFLLASLPACGGREPKVANLDSPGSTIVAFGDSITYGYGVRPGETYSALLSDVLGTEVINAGRNGDTTASGLERLRRDALDLDPRLVIVELGGNDFLEKVPREQTFKNLDRIVGECVDAGAMVALVHIQLGLFGDKYLDEYEAIAKRHGALLVRDVLDGVFGRPSMMVDQIHPNAQGHEVIAARIAEAVGPLLERADAARRKVVSERDPEQYQTVSSLKSANASFSPHALQLQFPQFIGPGEAFFLIDVRVGQEAAAGAVDEGLEGLVAAGVLNRRGQVVVDDVENGVEG